MRDNMISSAQEMKVLAGCFNLREVIFSWGTYSNPVCEEPAYNALIVASVPHLHRLDGKALSADIGDAETRNENFMPPWWGMLYNQGNLPSAWELPKSDNSASSKAPSDQSAQPDTEFIDPPQDFSYLTQPPFRPRSTSAANRPTYIAHSHVQRDVKTAQLVQKPGLDKTSKARPSERNTEETHWANQPSSSHFIAMDSLSHPHTAKTQSPRPVKGSVVNLPPVKPSSMNPPRKQPPMPLSRETEAGPGIQEQVPRADHSSPRNHEAWLKSLESKILDLVKQLPSEKTNPQTEVIGPHHDEVGSKAQRLDHRKTPQQFKKKLKGGVSVFRDLKPDSSSEDKALQHRKTTQQFKRKLKGGVPLFRELNPDSSSEDTSDGYKRRVKKILGKRLLSSEESESPTPQRAIPDNPARRWVHFGDKWKARKDQTRLGKNLPKEVATTANNDLLEQLNKEEKNLKEQELSKRLQKYSSDRGQRDLSLQEKYRGKLLSLSTELISLKEALNVSTQARQ